MEKIEEQIVALEQKISSLEILLKRPFAQWTDEETEEYGDKQQVREKEKQLREKEKQLREEKIQLREEKNLLLKQLPPLPQQNSYNIQSPTLTARETYIDAIQALVPNDKFSESLRKLLKSDRHFYHRLHGCLNWTKNDAVTFIKEAKLYLRSSTRLEIKRNKGYNFGQVLSHTGQANSLIMNVMDDKGNYCSKVGPINMIKKENDIGITVSGECVMPILDYFSIPDDRAVLVTPLYSTSLADWLLDKRQPVQDKSCVCILLCGISAIYSFAMHSICHSDIKLSNIMMISLSKYVLIDFGSATRFDGYISSTTRGISISRSSPSIGYDVSSLATVVAQVMLDEFGFFMTKEQLLFKINPLSSRFPTACKMMNYLPIDEEIDSIDKLKEVWRNLYRISLEGIPELSECSHFIPGE